MKKKGPERSELYANNVTPKCTDVFSMVWLKFVDVGGRYVEAVSQDTLFFPFLLFIFFVVFLFFAHLSRTSILMSPGSGFQTDSKAVHKWLW